MASVPEFKRVLFSLYQPALDRDIIGAAADLAELLRIDLLGMFVEDPDVTSLAALPFVREFRTLGRAWHPIEIEQLRREIDLSVMAARRLFVEATAARRVSCSFEVIKGTTAGAIRSLSQSTDIVVVAEPKSPVERITSTFPGLAAAALQSNAAVLMLPRRVVRTHGPVVAIAASPNDPCIEVAKSIGMAAKESVTVLAAHEIERNGATPKRDVSATAVVEYLPVPRSALASDRSIPSLLEGIRERLIVVTRGAFGSANEATLMSLASARSVPVLIVEPAGEPAK